MRVSAANFWDFVVPSADSECWIWRGSINKDGYGRFGSIKKMAHRHAYERLIGPIPERLVIDHLCRCRNCVNPQHMEFVTVGENVRRGEAGKHKSDQTHCPNGHELTPPNIRWRKKLTSLGEVTFYRHCRICFRATNTRVRRNWWRANRSIQARNRTAEVQEGLS